jgi:glutamyl/glutaminyl-tRNA synthetase
MGRKVEIAKNVLSRLKNSLAKAKAEKIVAEAARHSAETSLERQKARLESFREEIESVLPPDQWITRRTQCERILEVTRNYAASQEALRESEREGFEKDEEIAMLRQTIANMAIAAYGPPVEDYA